MRLQRITPSLFGKFTSTHSLNLPDNPMVVVFGENETGKSTYADLAVTLLSSTYDTDITDRYGDRGAPLKGQIDLIEDGSTLTVGFTSDATVPNRNTGVKRRPSDSRSPLWRKISSLDSVIIRTLFRLNASEIQNGNKVKLKFKNYGLGDRRGASIAEVIQRYNARVAVSTRKIGEAQTRLIQLRTDLHVAEQTGTQYGNLLSRIAEARDSQSRVRDEDQKIERELAALSVCSVLEPVISAARKAESNLQSARENGESVPETFGSIVTSLDKLVEDLSAIDLAGHEVDTREKQKNLDESTSRTDEELLILGLTRTSLLANITLVNQQNRNQLLLDLQNQLRDRRDLRENLTRLRDQDNTLEVDTAQQRFNAANAAWGKTGVSVSAHEYIARPETLDSPTLAPSSIGQRRRMLTLAAVVAVGAIVSAITGQFFGAAVTLVVGAVGAVLLGRSLTRRSGSESRVNGPVDAETLKVIAREVVESERELSDAKTALERIRATRPIEAARLDELESDIDRSLSGVGLAVDRAISPVDLNSVFDTIARLVAETHSIVMLSQELAVFRSQLENAQEKFNELKLKLLSAFSDAGIDISPERVSSPDDAIRIIQDWRRRWDEQVTWRATVSAVKGQIDQQPHLADLVRDFLSKSPEEREDIRKAAETKEDEISEQMTQLTEDITRWETAADELATESRIAELNAQIKTMEGEVLDHRIEVMRLQAQTTLVETLARKRAEEAKPELVRRVQEMVLAVAEDWAAIEFDEDGEIIHVERQTGEKVKDSSLSAGARSLLFTAMRVAIMQQESDGEDGFNIPLFCDDPLLHLDDRRTRQAMKMLRDQAHGHQIIYFTCKSEVRSLANELGIPVVNVG